MRAPRPEPTREELREARLTWLLAAALMLLWDVGLFSRNLWTPDEPREAALALSMSAGAMPLPRLGTDYFEEKPPLTYWLAGGTLRALGIAQPLYAGGPVVAASPASLPAALRIPQLGYALLAFGAVVALARRTLTGIAATGGGAAGGATAAPTPTSTATPRLAPLALAGGALFACCELVYQVQVWLATDALLLAGVCVALAAMYAALQATSRRERLLAYAVMHGGLVLAFFAKNFAAWLVPVLAFLGFIAWERRWRELARGEFWLPALLPIACIGAWTAWLASEPYGAQALRVLYWNNLAGRLVPVAAEARFDYASGHPNSPGGYLADLPIDLLPWTILAACALIACWRGVRAPGPARSAWRFAACVALPGLVVLSLAATARSIYAAPCMVGFVMMVLLWCAAPGDAQLRADAQRARALRATAVLVLLPALCLGAAALWLARTALAPAPGITAASLAGVALGMYLALRVLLAPPPAAAALLRLASAWALLLSLGVLGLYTAANRVQDLRTISDRIAAGTHVAPLVFWQPDETTVGWAQLYLPPSRWSAIGSAADGAGTGPDAAAAAVAQRRDAIVVSMARIEAWHGAEWRAWLRSPPEVRLRPIAADDARAAEPVLRGKGLVPRALIERPGGRGYVLWSAQADACCASEAGGARWAQ